MKKSSSIDIKKKKIQQRPATVQARAARTYPKSWAQATLTSKPVGNHEHLMKGEYNGITVGWAMNLRVSRKKKPVVHHGLPPKFLEKDTERYQKLKQKKWNADISALGGDIQKLTHLLTNKVRASPSQGQIRFETGLRRYSATPVVAKSWNSTPYPNKKPHDLDPPKFWYTDRVNIKEIKEEPAIDHVKDTLPKYNDKKFR